MKILLVRLSALGDVINAFPVLGGIEAHFPEAEVHWLTEDRCAGIVGMLPSLARIHVYRRRSLVDHLRAGMWIKGGREFLGDIRALRAERFDLALDLQGNLKSGVLTWLSGARRRIGFEAARSREMNHGFLTETVSLPPGPLHRVDAHQGLLRALGIDEPPRRHAPPVAEKARAALAERLAALGEPRRPLVVFHPGTSDFGAFKRWAPERFAAVGDALARERGARGLVTFGPGEKEIAQAVATASREGLSLFPTPTLSDLAALLATADLVVGGDTGPLHLASALGTPIVALFGPKDPALYAPYWEPREIVRADVDCSPCGLRDCDDVQCMLQITEARVIAAAGRLLDRARP
ncbi:MAG: glycosyltransferase family 9 protein [Myxococcales bacterium]|nr:glycosyltransferase family 9 protein [Myxococcales bacterium]